jgi:hypothetical protein
MAHHALTPEQLQAMVALVKNPEEIGIARQVVLKDFLVHDGDYVVCDALPDYPVVTQGAYLLKELSMVRTGILKNSEDMIEKNGVRE